MFVFCEEGGVGEVVGRFFLECDEGRREEGCLELFVLFFLGGEREGFGSGRESGF